MVQITIDAAMREKLRAAREEVRLVDEQGVFVGTFRPIDVPPYDQSLIPPISEEELRRRAAAPGGRSLAEILRDLEDRA